MADADVQGMLIRIEATTAQLRQEIARGEAAVAQSAGKMDSSLGRIDSAFDRTGANASALQQAVSSAFNGVSLASAGAVAGLVAITAKTAQYAQEVRNLSSLANASTSEFQRIAAGARTVGVEQEKLSDILKDVNDRVGEFISSGGGEMKDFFTNIAPKVGVTAEMFRNLSGPQALQLYYSSLEKANLNQQEMTFYMEAMADETTALIPLLRNNGQGFKDFGDQAERAGKVLSTIQIDRLVAVNQSIRTLETSFSGASNQLVVGLLPSIEQVTQRLNGMSDNGAMQALGAGISFLVENVNLLAGVLGAKVAASFISYASQVLVSTKATLADSLAVKGNALAKSEQAAAAAGLAAALATEASATVVTARATEEAALAKVRMLQAARDQLAYSTALAVGTAEEAKYTRALAATDVELTAAKKAAAQAGAQLGAVLTAESAALAKDTAATTAAAAAKTELAAASSLAARAGSGLLAVLGGPVGIAALAVGAGIAFLTMRDSTDQAAISLDEMKAPLDQVIAKFKTLNEDQRKAALVRWGEAQATAAKTAASEFGNLAASIRAATVDPSQARLGGYSTQLKEYSALIARLKEAQANGQSLTPILEGLRGKGGIDDAQINSWIKQAGAVSDAGGVLKDVTLKLNEQTGALTANTAETTANNAAKTGMSAAGSTYLQTLQKQLDGLQDGGDATKIANRYIAEHAELTDLDKSSILAKAAAIEAAKEATKQATAATERGSSAAKEAAAEAEKQTKALTDLKAQADIAINSATGLAAAYLAGTDQSREFSLQQKVEEALLKTGAAARAGVEKALKAQQNAQDKLNVSQSAYNLQQETTDLMAQAKATLMGADALAAYNVQKAMTVALAGKNVEVGSQEYEALLAATQAQQDAVKVAQQAANAGGILERLYPEAKLLKDYTADQQALNAAMALYPQNAANYQAALVKLGNEYEVNRSKATLWGQMTEGAIDRIDGVFANAWANIGSGADNLWDNLVKGAKQAFGEIAHMLTTKPLLASISNWLTGTDNGQGLSSVWGKLLGSATGQPGGSGGGFAGMGSNLVSMGKSIYQAYSAITGVGSSVASGYASGGVTGAIQGGAGYYGNMLSNIGSTLSEGFSTLASTFTGATAAQTAATIGAQGASSALLSGAVSQGATAMGAQFSTGVATTTAATYAAAEAGAAATASSLGGQISAAMGNVAAMWPLAVVMGMYQSGKLYDSGVRADAGEIMDSGGNTALGKAVMAPGAVMSKGFAMVDDALSPIVGEKWAAILSGSALHQAVTKYVGEKLFGSGYQTKDQGISLGVTGGDLQAYQYKDQKKKGGWLSGSSKSRTLLSPLDDATQKTVQDAFDTRLNDVFSLFDTLNVEIPAAALDGLNMAAWKISLKDLTTDQVNQLFSDFFEVLGNEAVGAISKSMGLGLDSYNVDQLTEFARNLYSINDTFKLLNVNALPVSVWGGKLAEQYVALAGGMEAFNTATQTYYNAFFTEAEKSADTLAAIKQQFANLNVAFPETREGFRGVVEGLDSTTDAGREMFLKMMGLASSASTAYDILAQQASEAQQQAAEAQQQAAEAQQKATAAAKAIIDGLMGTVTGAHSALQRAIAAQQKATTEAYNARITSLNDMVSAATDNVSGLTAVGNDLSAALKALRGDSNDAVQMLRAQAQATLQGALATARSGGSLSGFTGLEDALDTVSNNNTDLYGSLEDYARDQGRTANVVAELNGINGKQLSTAEKSLKGLQEQIKQAQDGYKLQMAQYDQQLEFAQAQMDALNGIDNSVVSVADAVKAMNAAVVAALGSIKSATPTNTGTLIDSVYQDVLGKNADTKGKEYWLGQVSNGSLGFDQLAGAIKNAAAENAIKDAYQSVLGKTADAAGAKYWSDQVASGALTVAQLEQAIKNAAVANGSIAGYATGGLIAGPGTSTSDSIFARLSNGEYVMRADAVRMFGTGLLDQMNAGQLPAFALGGAVGDMGPQLDIIGPAPIFSANRAGAMSGEGGDVGAILAELQRTREENKEQRFQMAKASKQMAALLQKWDVEGAPKERDYA